MKQTKIILLLCFLFSSIQPSSILAQEKEVDTVGKFACLDTKILKEASESATLSDLQRKASKVRQLSISETGVEFSTFYYLVDSTGWKVRANHNGIVITDRGLQMYPDYECLNKLKEIGAPIEMGARIEFFANRVGANEHLSVPACNPVMEIFTNKVIPLVEADFTWESMIFDEGNLTLTLRQFNSNKRSETLTHFSCMRIPDK